MEITRYIQLLPIAWALSSAPLAHADLIYDFSLDTSSLVGHPAGPFQLAFQLNDGSGLGNYTNSITLSDFDLGVGGSAFGSPLLFGGATGDVTSIVTITDSDFFNAFVQQ